MIQTNNKNFIKDPNTGALINTNEKELKQRKYQKRKAQEMSRMQNEINSIKDDVHEIKQTLRILMDRIQ